MLGVLSGLTGDAGRVVRKEARARGQKSREKDLENAPSYEPDRLQVVSQPTIYRGINYAAEKNATVSDELIERKRDIEAAALPLSHLEARDDNENEKDTTQTG